MTTQKLPRAVTEILYRYQDEEPDPAISQQLQQELEAIGWTIDYGLYGQPYNLRRLKP